MSGRANRFRFGLDYQSGVAILTLGETHYHADSQSALDAKFQEIEAKHPGNSIVVDLSSVALLSSTALRALRSAHRRLEPMGGRIVAAAGGELVAGVLKFAPFITHYATVQEAVDVIGAGTAMKER